MPALERSAGTAANKTGGEDDEASRLGVSKAVPDGGAAFAREALSAADHALPQAAVRGRRLVEVAFHVKQRREPRASPFRERAPVDHLRPGRRAGRPRA